MKILDINEKELTNGDIIDLHQTVNGENLFVVLDVEKLDVRYGFDLNYKYQYDSEELFKPSRFTGEVDFEIVGNVYMNIKKYKNE
jgi:hypothetical protein